jgi:alanyl-tRNA synthetase
LLYQLVAIIRDQYQQTYPELAANYTTIVDVLKQEEKRFFDTLERGQKLLEDSLETVKATSHKQLAGDIAFKLYDTYGFPLELTQDLAEAEGVTVDTAGFDAAMAQQKDLARANQKQHALVQDDVFTQLFAQVGKTTFTGYHTLSDTATVKALLVNGHSVDRVEGTNQVFEAILDQTPFYAESGGQVGDRGTFLREDGHHGLTVVVNDTQKVGELVVHRCLFDNGGSLSVGETLIAQVDPLGRKQSAIHHSSTHLLQAALRKVLGDSVHQAGSKVGPDGARFDFTFHRPVNPDELARVEYWMNQWVRDNLTGDLLETDMDTARTKGALMMADEKYGDTVRMIAFGCASIELCGGTHVSRTGDIGLIKITSESGIAAGVRRIELVAGEAGYKAFKQVDTQLKYLATQLKTPAHEVLDRVEKLQQQLKAAEKQIEHLEEKQAAEVVKALLLQADDNGVVVQALPGKVTPDRVRWITEKLSDHLTSRVVVLGAVTPDDKVAFVASVSDDKVANGTKAGDLVKQAASVCGGGGGGKPTFAQAGGKDPAKLADALQAIEQQLLAPR